MKTELNLPWSIAKNKEGEVIGIIEDCYGNEVMDYQSCFDEYAEAIVLAMNKTHNNNP